MTIHRPFTETVCRGHLTGRRSFCRTATSKVVVTRVEVDCDPRLLDAPLARIMHEAQPGSGLGAESGYESMKVGEIRHVGLVWRRDCGVLTPWDPIAGSQRQLCHSPLLAPDIVAELLVPTRG